MTQQYWQRYKQQISADPMHSDDQFWKNVRADIKQMQQPKHHLQLYSMCKSDNPYIRQVKSSPNITIDTVAELICRDKACELQYCMSLLVVANQNRRNKIDLKGCIEQYNLMTNCINMEKTRINQKELELRNLVNGVPVKMEEKPIEQPKKQEVILPKTECCSSLYTFCQFQKSTHKQLQTTMLKQIDSFDKRWSTPILQLDSKLVSAWLYPFSSMFQPETIYIPTIIIYLLSGKSLYDAAFYLATVTISAILSTLLKKVLRRHRPAQLKHLGKPQSFRTKQTNFSLPSGDTVQSVVFAVYAHMVCSVSLPLAVFFHVNVALSRVYFMCHWIGDTLLATLLTVPFTVYAVGLRDQNYLQWGHSFESIIMGWFGY